MKWARRASVLIVLGGCSTSNGLGSSTGAATESTAQTGGGGATLGAAAGAAGASLTVGQGGATPSAGSASGDPTSTAGNAQGGEGASAGATGANAGAAGDGGDGGSNHGNGGTEPVGGSTSGGTSPDVPIGGASTDGGLPPDTNPEPDLGAFRLVVIGSSTSAGEGASSSELGWVSLLTAALEERAPDAFSGRNLSVGGYSSESLLPGSGSSGNIDDAIEEDPNLIVVALAGSNDLSAGVDGETFMERLGAIRDAGEEAGIPVFFVSTAPKDLSDDEQEALRDWASEMASTFEPCRIPDQDADYSPCFIDVFDALANDSLGIDSAFGEGDGIHLNDAGHEEIFHIAEAIIEPYVCSRVPCE